MLYIRSEFTLANSKFMFRKILSVLSVFLFVLSQAYAQRNTLSLVKTIPLPGVHGKFDHMAYDNSNHRLYLAAKLNNSVEVIDLQSGKTIQSIKEVSLPQGILYLSSENMILVCGGGDGTLKGFDATNYKLRFTLKLGEEADNIRYSAVRHTIYVAYGDGAIAEIDGHTLKKNDVISFGAHPEAFQFDADAKKIWVNVPDKEEIKVINANTKSAIATWQTPGHADNFPMAFIAPANKLVVASRKNPAISILNSKTGKVLQSFTCDSDPDAMFYNQKTDQVFASCGGGSVYILNKVSAPKIDKPVVMATRKGARTCLFVPELNSLFIALPELDAKIAEIRMYKVMP